MRPFYGQFPNLAFIWVAGTLITGKLYVASEFLTAERGRWS